MIANTTNQTLLLHAYGMAMATVDNAVKNNACHANSKLLIDKAKAAYSHACDLVNHA